MDVMSNCIVNKLVNLRVIDIYAYVSPWVHVDETHEFNIGFDGVSWYQLLQRKRIFHVILSTLPSVVCLQSSSLVD